MQDKKIISLFGEELAEKETLEYMPQKIKTDAEMFSYLKQFLTLEEEPLT